MSLNIVLTKHDSGSGKYTQVIDMDFNQLSEAHTWVADVLRMISWRPGQSNPSWQENTRKVHVAEVNAAKEQYVGDEIDIVYPNGDFTGFTLCYEGTFKPDPKPAKPMHTHPPRADGMVWCIITQCHQYDVGGKGHIVDVEFLNVKPNFASLHLNPNHSRYFITVREGYLNGGDSIVIYDSRNS